MGYNRKRSYFSSAHRFLNKRNGEWTNAEFEWIDDEYFRDLYSWYW